MAYDRSEISRLKKDIHYDDLKKKGMSMEGPLEGNAFGYAMQKTGGDYDKAKAMLQKKGPLNKEDKKKERKQPPIKKISIPPIYLDKKEPSNKYIKLKKKSDDPMAWMNEDKSSQEKEKKKKKKKRSAVGLANKSIKELYGSEFGELSAGQQKYILDNQEIMRRITQQILTRVARVNLRKDLNVNKTNIIVPSILFFRCIF